MTTWKNNRFNDQNNSSARASRFLVHFFGVHCTTTTWNLVLWRTWTYDDEFSFLFLNPNKILKNSTQGKVACIWHIERVRTDAIKFEGAQTNFFGDVFTAVVVVVAVRSVITQHGVEDTSLILGRPRAFEGSERDRERPRTSDNQARKTLACLQSPVFP